MGLSEALAIAQGQFKQIIKDKHVDFTTGGSRVKYSYATLSTILDAIRQPLADNKLALSQVLGYQDGIFGLKTLLIGHDDKLESFIPLPNPNELRPQQFGSFLTYMRRYSVTCLLGLESEDDDDGARAQEIEPKRDIRPKPKNHAPLSTMDEIMELAKNKGLGKLELQDALKKATGKSQASECSPEELMALLAFLRMKS